jgi:hypothetical protein
MTLQPTLSLVLLCIEVSLSHAYRHTVGLLWTSDQPVAESSSYLGQHKIYIHETNIHALSGIRTHGPSTQEVKTARPLYTELF